MKKLSNKVIKNTNTIKGGDNTTPELTMSQLNLNAVRPFKDKRTVGNYRLFIYS